MRHFTIARQVGIAVVLLAVVAVGQSLAIHRQAAESTELATRIAGRDLTALIAVKDAQFAVAQVQQWLTDISATRGLDGLDGLDDGFDKAAEYAARFRELTDKLADRTEGSRARIATLQRSFDAYYESGRRMARAYVESGPAGGNALMALWAGPPPR